MRIMKDLRTRKNSRGSGTISLKFPIFSIRYKYYPLENIDYEIFGGFVVMNLTLNHLKNLYNINISNKNYIILRSFIEKKNRIKNILILTKIFPGSYLKSLDILSNGEIITKMFAGIGMFSIMA